ncbi:MAG: F0F1 ATP synthase subunit A [Rhodobacterales bacterium]|nr:F0F1 ATP synthase subunit A [Rhodobacterales bacterium]
MAKEEAGNGLVFHPMDQFEIKTLFGDGPVHWYSFTNATLWMGLTVLAVFALLVLGTSRRAMVPNRVQSIGELAYGFIYRMIEDVAGKDGVKYFPHIMTLFMFIVFSNFLGLLPMAFTTTSHIAVTGVLAMGVFLSVTILGFVKHGFSFFGLFWISSAPLILRPILALIEIISYFVRPLSHSIRLAGNMMAGHAVIKVFAAFAAVLAISPFAIIAITAISALEVLVAFIQAYVFAILTCVYLKDALHPNH